MLMRAWEDLNKFLEPNRVLVIYGPRRVGKTTLIENFLKKTDLKYRLDSGDDINLQTIVGSQSVETIKRYAEGLELVVIDEAQKIPQIGVGLKILVDHFPGIKVIATGSASFDLANKIGEPLTGRKRTILLYPIAQTELLLEKSKYDLNQNLEDYLIYGSYPEVLTSIEIEKKINILNEIVGSYLFRDILELERVKGAKVLLDLLRLLAYQVGNEVTERELGQNLDLDSKTVARYLDLLEKSFVILNLRGLSRNLRSEVTRTSKYYFYDLGVRNALIQNFNRLTMRDDVGKLWENFLFIERIKKQAIAPIFANNYFWRTWEQKEIDFVEEREGKYYAYEFKYKQSGAQLPKDFANAYKNSQFEEINKENYLEFVD